MCLNTHTPSEAQGPFVGHDETHVDRRVSNLADSLDQSFRLVACKRRIAGYNYRAPSYQSNTDHSLK
jgi:hypothetical protein